MKINKTIKFGVIAIIILVIGMMSNPLSINDAGERQVVQTLSGELKVAAGLSPKEKAEFEMKTKIGVAAELAKVKVPNIVIGGGNGGATLWKL